jgi:hypothetical protein
MLSNIQQRRQRVEARMKDFDESVLRFAAGADVRGGRPVSRFARLDPRIKKNSLRCLSEFIPVQISGKTATSKAASHFQEEFMTRLIRSGQNVLQVLPWTLH